ncbi:MAG TPA: right-handed parallel beta-helix repeat-containing protein, partial [Bacteroidales bacterium]|nr:right-handed parallel beta-helix repeat-containing protein [Bacteroidales bacterium]
IVNVIIVMLLVGQNIASGQKIYVSPKGNDSNSGTVNEPLATLNSAINKSRLLRGSAQTKDPCEIIIMPGTYFMLQPLEIRSEDSGSPYVPLVIKAEGDERPVFTGGVKIEGFERDSENLWRAFIPQVAWYDSYFEQLYVNGRRAVRAQTPNDGFYFIKSITETVLEKGEGRSPEFAVQKIGIDPSGADCFRSFTEADYNDAIVTFYHKWDNTRKRVAHFNNAESSIYTVGTGMKPWNALDNKTRYKVENYKAALDAPGEWYLERSGYLWYIPLPGEDPEKCEVIVPILKDFISIKGESADDPVKHIRFENISFRVAGYRTPDAGNEPAQAAAPVDAVITLDYADNISFVNCEITHTGTYAFWFRRGCANCTVNQCYMHDLGAGGVKIGETVLRPQQADLTKNIIIDNNIITDAGHIFPCAVGVIIFHSSDNQVIHNEISNLRYSGISVGWIWGYAHSPSKRNTIKYNHIHHLGWGELCDMGGVYTLGASEGTSVSNNLIHHVYSFDYGGWGLYTDEGSYGITMENNLVYACKNSGFHQHYGKENIIRNNILAYNIRSQLQATRIEEHRSLSFTNNIIYYDKGTLLSSNWHKFNLLSDYNCYWDKRSKDVRFADKFFKEWQTSGKDQHSVIADPMFINPEEFDFRFRKLSIARKIKFTPFDYSKAGVYGSDEWKKLAEMSMDLKIKFDNIVNVLENKAIK